MASSGGVVGKPSLHKLDAQAAALDIVDGIAVVPDYPLQVGKLCT